jgi:hypothetical protein
MHDVLIGRPFNRSEHRQQERYNRTPARFTRTCASIWRLVKLFSTHIGEAGSDAGAGIRRHMGQLAETVNKAEELLGPDDSGRWSRCAACTRSTGSTVRRCLKAFDFKGAPNSQPLLKPIDLLRTLHESARFVGIGGRPRKPYRRARRPLKAQAVISVHFSRFGAAWPSLMQR